MKFYLICISLFLSASCFAQKPKPHPPVRTFALWFSNPGMGKDTGTLVYRLDYDTVAPYKKWAPRYFVPQTITYTVKRAGKADSTVYGVQYFFLKEQSYLIHDFDKHY